MRLLKLLIVILPLAELAAFVLLAREIGVAATLAAAIATSVAGIIVLRIAGRRTFAQIRAVASGRIGEADFGRPFFSIAAGVLLVVPGFLTDLVGVLLLLPPLQKLARAALRHLLRSGQPAKSEVVDLEPGEWNRVQDESPARSPAEPAPSLSPGTRCVSHTGEQGGAPSRHGVRRIFP